MLRCLKKKKKKAFLNQISDFLLFPNQHFTVKNKEAAREGGGTMACATKCPLASDYLCQEEKKESKGEAEHMQTFKTKQLRCLNNLTLAFSVVYAFPFFLAQKLKMPRNNSRCTRQLPWDNPCPTPTACHRGPCCVPPSPSPPELFSGKRCHPTGPAQRNPPFLNATPLSHP